MSAIRRITAVLLCVVALAGCQEDGGGSAGAETAFPDVSAKRAACERDGGRWGSVPGRDAFTCFRTTSDANDVCSTGRDCEGQCLARSRTCAPITPLFGCHEIISDGGLRQTMCTE